RRRVRRLAERGRSYGEQQEHEYRTSDRVQRVHPLPLLRADDVVFEVARGIRLRPQPHLAGDGRTQNGVVLGEEIGIWGGAAAAWAGLTAERVLERELAVEEGLQIRAVDRELELVPVGACWRELVRAVAEAHVASDAVVELPERHVVLGVVIADSEPVAVR